MGQSWPMRATTTMTRPRSLDVSNIESEIRHVPILHHVVFPLDPDLPLRLERRLRPGHLQIVRPINLRADEPSLDIAVHLPRGLARHGPSPDRPRPALVRPRGEKAYQIE